VALKRALKTFRASQPFNAVATTTTRAIFQAARLRSGRVEQALARVGTVRAALPNGRTLMLWSRGDDGVSNAVYWGGWAGYEPEATPLWFRLAARAAITLDIGANVGYHAMLAAHANPHGRVYAFEPLPMAAERLRLHRQLNDAEQVEWIGAAVSATSGTASFYVGEGGIPVGASLSADFVERIRREAPVRWRDQVLTLTVPVVTIDEFAAERGLAQIDLVKVDAESAEPLVLRGMANVLRRDRPAILCEVLESGETAQAIEALLGPLGYRYYHLRPDGPRLTESLRGYGYAAFHNYLLTPLGPEQVAQL
jgi:FkbM family methyltransferase